MKTLLQMLRELARPEVSEFAVVTERLPCIKIAGQYEPVNDKAPTASEILDLLVATGGGQYLAELEKEPHAWTSRMEGLGTVGIQVIQREGRIQARFTVVKRPTHPPAAGPLHPTGAAGRKSAPPPRRRSSKNIPAVRPGDEAALDRASEPHREAQAPVARAAAARPARPAGSLAPLDELLFEARETRGSDVHVVAGRPLLVRTGGELVPRGQPLSPERVETMVRAIVPERLRERLEAQGSCDFALDRGEDVGRFRVNVSRQRTGLKACFRLIAPGIPTLESLGLPLEIERATHHHQGLVVVTGPTGHGKTSTLAAIVDILNRETTHHIITVEDPVEYLHPRKKAMVSQREVGSNTRSFAAALKGSLREDPDVIVVGELRDTETVRMALAASETGHLVLGTMNTPSAAKTIDRLIDLFPPADQQQVRMTLAGGLHLIVSQRLVPAADGGGVVAAVELLPGSIALWSLIRDNKTFQIPSIQQRGRGFGILRLDESLYEHVKAGRTTKEAALAVAENYDELEGWLSGKRPPPGTQAVAPPGVGPAKPDAGGGLLGKAGQLFGKKG